MDTEVRELIEKVQKLFADNNGGFKTQEQVSEMKVKDLFQFLVLNGLRDISSEPEIPPVEILSPGSEISLPLILPTGHTLEYLIEEEVFLKTDPAQRERLVSEIVLLPQNAVMYRLSCETVMSTHYSFELDFERDIVKATSG